MYTVESPGNETGTFTNLCMTRKSGGISEMQDALMFSPLQSVSNEYHEIKPRMRGKRVKSANSKQSSLTK